MILKVKKCCVCKMPVPPKIKQCPVCGKEYSKLEYFRMNWLSRVILLLIAAIILYNVAVVIVFNRGIRKFIQNPPEEAEAVARMEERYERLNPVQKYFVHYSEIENLSENGSVHEITEGDGSITVTVYSQNGSTTGAYKGELIGSTPDGVGEYVFTDENGLECTYEGEFKDGKIQGAGEMRLSSGEVLKGSFFEGQLNGYGKTYNPDGTLKTRGVYVNNRLNGKGVIYGKDGIPVYEGEFVYGLPEKRSFLKSCSNEDVGAIISNFDEYDGKNVAVTGILTDILIGEDLKKYYIFAQDGNDNQRFIVDYEGKPIRFNLWSGYTVYGYCEAKEDITDSHNITTKGVRLKGFYTESE